MSYSPGIGLQLHLALDSSGVAPGLQDFDQQLDDATEKWNHDWEESTKSVDKGLISNRETARLLSEELGIHLPRAVTTALGEMLPAIGLLGPALLGAFAGEEIVKFAEHAKKAADAVNEIAQSEKLVKEIGEENVKAMEAMAKKSVEYAHTQLALLNAQIVAGEADVERLKRHAEGLDSNLAALTPLLNAYHFWVGQSKELKTAEQGLDEQLKLRDALMKILGDDMAKANKEAAKGADERGNAAKRALEAASREAEAWGALMAHAAAEDERLLKRMQQWHEEWLKALGMPEEAKFSLQEITRNIDSAGRAAASTLPSLTALGGGFRQLTEAEREALPLSGRIDDALLRQAQHARDVVSEIEDGELPARRRIEAAYQKQVDAANREIAAKREEYAQGKILRAQIEADEAAYTQLMVDLAKQRQKAEHDENQARREEIEGEAAGLGEAVAGLINSKKMEAEVEGAFDVAKSIECMAKFIDSGGTDAAALLASVKYGVSAAEFFKVAGKSGGATGAGAGGVGGQFGTPSNARDTGYGREDRSGRIGAGDQFVSGSGLAPGAQGSTGGRLQVVVIGESETARFFANGVNAADAAGHFMTVSTARRSAPAQG